MDDSKNVSKEPLAVDGTIYNLRRDRTPSTKKKESEMERDTKPPKKKSRRSIENNTGARHSVFTRRQDTPGPVSVGQQLENLALGGGSTERGEPRTNLAKSSTSDQVNPPVQPTSAFFNEEFYIASPHEPAPDTHAATGGSPPQGFNFDKPNNNININNAHGMAEGGDISGNQYFLLRHPLSKPDSPPPLDFANAAKYYSAFASLQHETREIFKKKVEELANIEGDLSENSKEVLKRAFWKVHYAWEDAEKELTYGVMVDDAFKGHPHPWP